MSKKTFKSQASSSRAGAGALGDSSSKLVFGGSSAFGAVPSSQLSFIYEPPDLSGITDPNVGVAFKNVQKKDSTTKAKALEELQAYVSTAGEGELEDAVLETWIKVYPRTSIDSSRRVRQLAHTLQGQIALSCGKRISKHMHTVVPSWIAGFYDNDKSVSRAATEAFNGVFSSEEKKKAVRRLYQSSIFEYSKNIIAKEATATLSDERSVSPDEASAKYSRVVGAAISMVTVQLESAPEANTEKTRTDAEGFLAEEKLWKLATHSDPFVRRAMYRLLNVVLAKQKDSLNLSVISMNVLTLGLYTDQTGSALDFAKVLSALAVELPATWTLHYIGTGKKSAQNRLKHFLRKGSRGGPPDFWLFISSLVSKLPLPIVAGVEDGGNVTQVDNEINSHSSVLIALREGINNKDEARINQNNAWSAYLDAFERVQASLSDHSQRQELHKNSLLPILDQYIRPSSELSSWTISGPQQQRILSRMCNVALLHSSKLFREKWQALSKEVIEDLKTSLPEQSKEYARSQDSLIAEADRWYHLSSSLVDSTFGKALRPTLESTVPFEFTSALTIIKSRNGKPYSAAAAAEKAVRCVPDFILHESATRKTLSDFAHDVIPELVFSPSVKYLTAMLGVLEDQDNVSEVYKKCLQKLAESPESDARVNALSSLFTSPRLAHDESSKKLVTSTLQHALKDDDERSWKIVVAAITNSAATSNFTHDVLVRMIDDLSINADKPAGLRGLEMTARHDEAAVRELALSPKGSSLLSALLSLCESSDDDIAQRAKNLYGIVERGLAVDGSAVQVHDTLLDVIRRGIGDVGVDSLSIDVIVGQAQKLIEQIPQEQMPERAPYLFPTAAQWTGAMEPFILRKPNPSIAITNLFSGAVSLITSPSPASAQQLVARDADGFSSAYRMAKYTVRMLHVTKVFDNLGGDQKAVICGNLALFLQLASDNLSITGSIPLWLAAHSDDESEVIELVAEGQAVLASWLADETALSEFVGIAQRQLLSDADGLLASSYYSGRAYSALIDENREIHQPKIAESDTGRLKAMRKSTDVFASAASLTSAWESKELQRFSNELLADLTVHDFHKSAEEGLRKLVLLNCIVYRAEEYIEEIPQQRLVFFVKHATPVLETLEPSSALWGQLAAMLALILPVIRGIYGEFWAVTFDAIISRGLRSNRDESLFSIHSSLRLLWLLRKPEALEANDDLLDAWNERKGGIWRALLGLLVQLGDTPDGSHQPRRIINELLGRLLSVFDQDLNSNAVTLYPTLASESSPLQEAAYKLLHLHIPSAQEQVSVDKALSSDLIAQLPQELLSLVLTAPTIDDIAEANIERTIPLSLRSYLLSWKLIFDHWQNASYKVQADYVAALQEGTYLPDLLNLAFNILIATRTKPLDASKFNIENYNPNSEESPEKETHWLLIHLYYLSLRHLPTLTKTWWRDSTSRQLNLTISTWTEKHISPLIIASELSTMTNWAPSQAIADQPMTIKVSPSARELTASIPIDDQQMSISITLPPSYPLARAEVTSVHRVGVPQQKWNFWLINTQGVINFSSGGAGEGNALIDGLMAWRKNVTAAMKGQTECAICYSVVSQDRQLPSKRCGTCRNMFHSGCLFRWFKSSNSSSCPLCRNAFHYS